MPPCAQKPILAALAACLIACAAPSDYAEPKTLPKSADVIFFDQYVQAEGKGRAGPGTLSDTQRKSESRDAALADARARLKGYLEPLAAKSKPVALDKLILSAEIVYTHWEDDGSATTLIRLKKASINEALGTEYK